MSHYGGRSTVRLSAVPVREIGALDQLTGQGGLDDLLAAGPPSTRALN